ncbi:hypothetical protein DMB66_41535 [Actinoplanes sp. ATCC 53533]|uniref:site-specific integrase n=1 Tax=Actinoplanes sp. ATCC 53533 TaxID=1288362 RepID=UPI000F7929AB|nr:site-specific integrase [Actinoplanes sp. ATCC 53533]RSM51557.1 hypothetical protein DMB66_41535 [Actinoplanes sp. ATCC 53533]
MNDYPVTAAHLVTRRSPFAGQPVAELVGLTMNPTARPPMFDDPVWDFAGVANSAAQLKPNHLRFDFTGIPRPDWQLLARELMIALLCPTHAEVATLPRARRTPLHLSTCHSRLYHLIPWLQWLAEQDITSLRQVTQEHCERYLQHLNDRRPDRANVMHDVLAMKDVALYTELFTADSYQPGFIPWPARAANVVAGFSPRGENKTQPVPPELLQPGLTAALFLVQTVGPHVLGLLEKIRAAQQRPVQISVARHHEVRELISRYVQQGRPLPQLERHHVAARLSNGWHLDDPLLHVSFGELAHEVSARQVDQRVIRAVRDLAEQAVAAVGIQPAWAREAVTVVTANGTDNVAWTEPLTSTGANELAAIVFTACLFVTSAVSGMRSSEPMELTIGSCTEPREIQPGLFRFGLSSKRIKSEQWGGVPDEWIVIEPAYRAVELAARLAAFDTTRDAADTRVFGRFAFVNRLKFFRRWINGPAGIRLGLRQIPSGPITVSMLRRTLALELGHRPHGLLAAKTHLKHISVATTEGYTRRPGGAQAKFHTEVTAAETARKAKLAAAIYRDYQAGRLPAGPGARDLIDALQHVDTQLDQQQHAQPTVVATDRHIELLLKKKAATLHIQAANYCWFTDPAKALCLKLAGTPTATTPLAGLCDAARCPQATFHRQHREVWAGCATTTATFLGNPRLPAGEATRLGAEHARAQRVVDAIDAATDTGAVR